MSPPPLSTATLNFHGGGSWAAAAEPVGPDRPAANETAAARTTARSAETAIASQRPNGFVGAGPAGRPERRFASRSSISSAVAQRRSARTTGPPPGAREEARKSLCSALGDLGRRRVAQERKDSCLAAREAVEAAFLEPLDLVGPE